MTDSASGGPNGQGEDSAEARFVLYTTTTCGPCLRLKHRLDDMGISYDEVNVEDDVEASSWVMSVNRGDRVVPTLLFRDGSWLTNPSAQQVLDHLAHHR